MSQQADSTPTLTLLSRRQLLVLLAGATGGAALAGVPRTGLAGQVQARPPATDPERESAETAAVQRFRLPDEPSQNPAFMARAVTGGGLLVWSAGGTGFRLNRAARRIWRLCDGTRSVTDLAAEHARRSGRPAAEGEAFVQRLLELSVVVAGAEVTVPGFPAPEAGGSYHRRIEPDDPVTR